VDEYCEDVWVGGEIALDLSVSFDSLAFDAASPFLYRGIYISYT
jgi:hypothetical protein